MKRFILLTIVILSFGFAKAQSADAVLSKSLAAYNNKSVSASYSASSQQGSNSGTIIMKGKLFQIISNDLKCWYNGKTLWTYAKSNGEVNISEPSSNELQTSNPYFALSTFRVNFTTSIVANATSTYTIKLVPKRKNSDINNITLSIDKNNNYIQKATVAMRNKTTINIALSNYKSNTKVNNNTFVFNKNQVPKGTQIVDLR